MSRPLPWVRVARNAPYFETALGEAWTPIGQNDAISWPDLEGAFRRRDVDGAERYVRTLAEHGVTCMRLMLEYCQEEGWYFESSHGRFDRDVVGLWDDVFALCERYGVRVLLTPYDTFWMWLRWPRHPYNRANGGPCADRSRLLLCPETRSAVKARLAFASERWGASGALFAWDLWNEVHTAHAGDCAGPIGDFVEDVSGFLRRLETRLYGRAHPQTVSVFGPHLDDDERIPECVFRHPSLDFASAHFYEHGSIDDPQNTVDAAVSVGRLTREALSQLRDGRPFFE